MHTIRNALAALLLLPCILAASSAPPLAELEADLSRAGDVLQFDLRSGDEGAILVHTTSCGAPYTPASAEAWYQADGMGELWWQAPAEAVTGGVEVAWTHALEPAGAAAVSMLLRIDGRLWRGAVRARILPSPGYDPVALPVPRRILDFEAVEVANAPWATPADVDAAVAAARFAAAPVTSVNGATGDVVVAVVDLGAFAATGTVHAAESAGLADAALSAQGLDMPWGLAGHVGVGPDGIVREHPGVHGMGRVAYTNDFPVGSGRLATVDDIAATAATMSSRVDSAVAELAAIRDAADGIELPEDPTAAELGAAFRDLLLCIRNPTRAIRARAAAQEETR